MIDLTLDSVKIPAISGYTPPFGTKIVTTETNKGGLSTREVTEDVIKPFVKQRAVIITQDETTSTIEADSKIVVNGANATLTLGDGDEEGIELKIIAKESFTLNCNSQNYPYYKGDIVKLIWDGDNWLNNDENNVGDIKTSSKIIDDTHPAPLGWLLCDGREVSKSTYSALYEVIGDSYGTSSTTENFVLPDYRECVLVGAGQNEKMSITAHDVYNVGEFKDDQFQGHWHRVFDSGYTNGGSSGNGWACGYGDSGKNATTIKSDGINGSPRIGSTTHSKQIGVNFLIRY